jgi:hypothetical protein
MTHTYAILEISKSAFDEIQEKMEAAEYQDQFSKDDGAPIIDMHGIAIKAEAI